jgi:hypothetical protein
MAAVMPFRRPPRPRRVVRRSGRGDHKIDPVIVVTAILLAAATAFQWWALSLRPAPETMTRYDFRSCAEARAAHAAPLVLGEAWYRRHLDRDGDGIACEFHLPTAINDLLSRR